MPDVTTFTFWALFHLFLGIAIYADLFLLNRENTNNNMKLNLATVAMWIAVGLGFGFFVWNYKGPQSAVNYPPGHMLEQSLSVDNFFVFLGMFIFAGVALVGKFEWLLYPLGAFLVYTGIKLLWAGGDEPVDPEKNPALKFCPKCLPLTDDYVGNRKDE